MASHINDAKLTTARMKMSGRLPPTRPTSTNWPGFLLAVA
jgi:hypothetical protein